MLHSVSRTFICNETRPQKIQFGVMSALLALLEMRLKKPRIEKFTLIKLLKCSPVRTTAQS